MSVKGRKVLHIDRNDHYGGFAATIHPVHVQELNVPIQGCCLC